MAAQHWKLAKIEERSCNNEKGNWKIGFKSHYLKKRAISEKRGLTNKKIFEEVSK